MNRPQKKYRTLARDRGGKRELRRTQELVLTLTDGEVVEVETLDKSGKRKKLSEEEFADLVVEDDVSPEEVYATAIPDTSVEDELEFDDEGAREAESFERLVLRQMIADQLLRRFVRRFILRRLRKREMIRRQQPPITKVAQTLQ